MIKNSLLVENTETALNVALAELLQQGELQVLGEAIIHKTMKGIGKKPDVLITVNGIKLIVEGKFDIPSAENILEAQCIERIEDGLYEICIGSISKDEQRRKTVKTQRDRLRKRLVKPFETN